MIQYGLPHVSRRMAAHGLLIAPARRQQAGRVRRKTKQELRNCLSRAVDGAVGASETLLCAPGSDEDSSRRIGVGTCGGTGPDKHRLQNRRPSLDAQAGRMCHKRPPPMLTQHGLTRQVNSDIGGIGRWCPAARCGRKNRESGEKPERTRRCDRERTLHLSLAASRLRRRS